MNIFSLRTRLVVALGAILLLAFVSTSALNFLVTKRSLRTSTLTETLPLISDSIYSEIQSDLIRPIHNSSLMAHDSFVQDWIANGEQNLDEIVRYLRTIKEEYNYFTAFFVSEQTKNYYYYDGILKQISRQDDHDVWYFIFKDVKVDYDLDVDTDEASSGTLTVFINHRVEDAAGRFLGVAGVGLKMKNLGEVLASFHEHYDRLIYMVDSAGVVQLHLQEELVEQTNLAAISGLGDLAEAILSRKSGTQTYEFDREGHHLFMSTRYFPNFDWFLVVEQREERTLGPARSTLVGNLLVGALATAVVLLIIVWIVNRFQRRLEVLATTDELTRLHNRRHFMDLAQREAALAKRYGHQVSFLLIDVDHFKRVNDTYGHDTGDQVLRMMADTFRECLREVDILGRYGGEEFVVLLPQTDPEEAYQAAERLRETIANKRISTAHGSVACTVSVGMVTASSDEADLFLLLKKADQAMYQAKDQGRNQVCVSVSVEESP